MTSVRGSHPAKEQLLRYVDGELGGRDAGAIQQHLEACWQCRMEVQELQSLVGDCVRYRNEFLEACPPPAPWSDLRPQFARIDAGVGKVSWWTRATRWAPAAAAAALIAGVWFQLHETPSVQAAELLRKAVIAADARPQVHRRIRIRTTRHTLTRSPGSPMAAREGAGTEEVRALFVAARYSWEDPLSARSFRDWHDQLSGSRDEVTTLADGYAIRTFVESGAITEASLKLSRADLRPLAETLEFRNRERIEITEDTEMEASPPAAVAGAAAVPNPPARVATDGPAPATPADELQVVAALHKVGADLGDPVEITRHRDRVVVTGVGVDPARQEQIAQALAPLRHVVVHFSEPAASSAPASRSAVPEPPQPVPLRLQERLEAQLGGHASYEQTASQALDMSDAIMARVYALRRLAERFSPAMESELGAVERHLLQELRLEHTSVLSRQSTEIERLLAPVLPAQAAPAATKLPAGWQAATEELFQAARRVEVLTAAVFAGTPSAIPEAQLPAELSAALAQLRSLSLSYGSVK